MPADSPSTVFISIAAYRDPELIPTLENLLDTARHPENIVFGICLQDTKEALARFPYDTDPFRVVKYPHKKSRGVCWARRQAQDLYDGETYYLQIDSHMRFIEHWDHHLIAWLKLCDAEKPILSTYPKSYTPDSETYLNNQTPNRLTCSGFYQGKHSNTLARRLVALPFEKSEIPARPQPSFFLSAGFLFTYGLWSRECRYDENIYFRGEEDDIAIRSWLNGWDIFYPHRVAAYHYYIRKEMRKHWSDHRDWFTKDQASIRYYSKKLQGFGQGEYHEGRTFAEYQRLSGVNYTTREIADVARSGIYSTG